MVGRRSRTPKNYLPLVTVVSLLILAGVWKLRSFQAVSRLDSVKPSKTEKASKPKQVPEESAPNPLRLRWAVIQGAGLSAKGLTECLVSQGMSASATGSTKTLLVVRHAGLPGPQLLRRTEGKTVITTPLDEKVYTGLRLHIASTSCLYTEGAEVVDDGLQRRLANADWPRLGKGGTVAVGDVLTVSDGGDHWVTRGLSRLGKPEILYPKALSENGVNELKRIAAYTISIMTVQDRLTIQGLGDVEFSASQEGKGADGYILRRVSSVRKEKASEAFEKQGSNQPLIDVPVSDSPRDSVRKKSPGTPKSRSKISGAPKPRSKTSLRRNDSKKRRGRPKKSKPFRPDYR